MSNVNQFFGGGGPSSVIRGSTSFTAGITGYGDAMVVTINTGVTVNASRSYLIHDVRYFGNFIYFVGNIVPAYSFVRGGASARISNNQVLITTGGTMGSETGGNSVPTTFQGRFAYISQGVVDWQVVQY